MTSSSLPSSSSPQVVVINLVQPDTPMEEEETREQQDQQDVPFFLDTLMAYDALLDQDLSQRSSSVSSILPREQEADAFSDICRLETEQDDDEDDEDDPVVDEPPYWRISRSLAWSMDSQEHPEETLCTMAAKTSSSSSDMTAATNTNHQNRPTVPVVPMRPRNSIPVE